MVSYKLSIPAAFLWMYQRENDLNSSKAPRVNITRDNRYFSTGRFVPYRNFHANISLSKPSNKTDLVGHVLVLFVGYSLNVDDCSL